MSFFQKLKKQKLFLFFAVIFIGSIYLSFHFLPQITEKIITVYLHKQGFEDVHLKIDTITAHELSISSFHSGKEKELTLSKAKFLYSFNEILKGKIDSIEVAGLSVNLHLNKGKVSSGILKTRSQGESTTKSSLPTVLPFNKLTIRNSFINILTPDKKITASLSGNIDSSKGLNFIKSNFDVTLRDQSRNLTAKAFIEGSPSNFKGNFNLRAEGGINLPETVDIPQATINMKGNISFHNNLLNFQVSNGEIRLEKPINVKKHKAAKGPQPNRASAPEHQLKNSLEKEVFTEKYYNALIDPFLLSLKKETKAEFQIDLTDIKNPSVSYDLQLEPTLLRVNIHSKSLKNIPISFNVRVARFNGSGHSLNYEVKSFIEEDLFIKADKMIVSLNGSIYNPTKTPLIKSDIQINLRNKDGRLNVKASIEGSPSNFKGNLNLSAEGGVDLAEIIHMPSGVLSLKSEVSYHDSLFNFHLKDASLRTDKIMEAGTFNAWIEPFQLAFNKNKTAKLSVDLKKNRILLSDIHFAPSKIKTIVRNKNKDIAIHFDFQNMNLSGELSFAKGKLLDYKIFTALKESGFSIPEFEVSAENMVIKAEISSQNAANKIKTFFSNVQLKHDRETPYLVPLFMRGEFNLTNGLSEFNGQIKSFNNELVLDFSGTHETQSSTGKARFKLHPLLFSKDTFRPVDIFPVMGDSISNTEGQVEIDGTLSWHGEKMEPDVLVNIRDFSFSFADVKFDGINGTIKFDGLAPLSTPPNQTLTISKAEAGLPLKNGKIYFTINSEKIFFEKIKWEWADGTLHASSFQTKLADLKIKKLILNVSDIQLNDLLLLTNRKDFSGTGVLSGKIPVEFFDDGAFTVSEGFLEASPEGGVLRYRPAASMSFLSADNENIKILLKALDDFHYKKLKLTLKGGTKKGLEGFLSIYGSNPALYNGRTIELNVNLTGALMEVLQSTLGIYKIPGQIQKRLVK